jgi:hypothetical protein
MARKLRVQYPGAIHHAMNRGDRREPIFNDDNDRLLFLETLGEACQKTDWQVHAWCLMSNHFQGTALFQTNLFPFPVEGGLINLQDLSGFGQVGGFLQDLSKVCLLQFFHGNQRADL